MWIRTALASLALVGMTSPMHAQAFDAEVYAADVRGWQVDSLTDAQGFLGCGGTSVDQPFGVLGVIQSRDGWLLRVPTMQTESFGGAVVSIGTHKIDAQVGFLPEGAGEIMLSDEAVGWLAGADAVTVDIPNDYNAAFGLLGSAAMITKVKECYERQGKGALAAAPAVENDALRAGQDCPAPGSLVSGTNGTPANLTFVNRADVAVSLYWLGFDGQPVEYAALLPGETYTIDTWAEHLWLARDFEGKCRGGVIYPAPGKSVWEIK